MNTDFEIKRVELKADDITGFAKFKRDTLLSEGQG